jgi:hypothetical protein
LSRILIEIFRGAQGCAYGMLGCAYARPIEDLKNKGQERFESVKAEAQDLYDKAQKVLDEAKPCSPLKPNAKLMSDEIDRLGLV